MVIFCWGLFATSESEFQYGSQYVICKKKMIEFSFLKEKLMLSLFVYSS